MSPKKETPVAEASPQAEPLKNDADISFGFETSVHYSTSSSAPLEVVVIFCGMLYLATVSNRCVCHIEWPDVGDVTGSSACLCVHVGSKCRTACPLRTHEHTHALCHCATLPSHYPGVQCKTVADGAFVFSCLVFA